MYQATTQFNNVISGNGRTFQAKISAEQVAIPSEIFSVKITFRSCKQDYISFGYAVSASAEITMEKPTTQLKNQEFDLSIGLQLGDDTEWIPMGKFTAEEITEDEGRISFTAYDRIYSKMSGAYFSELEYPKDGKTVLQEIATKTGVPIATSNLPDGVLIPKRTIVSEKGTDDEGNTITESTYAAPFDGYTYKEALGYIAQFYGKFAVANRSGEIEFRWYTETEYSIEADQCYNNPTKSEQVFEMGAIICQTGSESIKAGTGSENVQIENPVMVEERLRAVYDSINSLTYLPAQVSFLGDPRIDLGDILKVYDRVGNLIRVPVMYLLQDFDGGLLSEIKSFDGSSQETSAQKGPTAQALDRTYQDLFLVKELIGNKASFDYVKIIKEDVEEISGDYASFKTGEFETLKGDYTSFKTGEFETLKADYTSFKSGEFETLKGDFLSFKTGEFETLKGDYTSFKTGEFETLKADVVNYKTTITEELLVAKGWMAEGSIGDAQISSVSANKLKAGTIDTALITIAGSDGKLQIVDNTLQISDTNRVRVQIGKDASEDYTLAVWDASGNLIWDALGATENTIQRPIVKDQMIAEDAGIKAFKIDYQSFETALTDQGVVISGTVVQVGEKNLNVVLSEQTQAIDNIKVGSRNLIRNSRTLNFEDYYFGEYMAPANRYLLNESGAKLLNETGKALIA